jgi:hypothetical protein
MSKITKNNLFKKLANPDNLGISRWVNVKEFINEFIELKLGNGASWCRKNSTLAYEYNIEFDKSITSGNTIDRIRLNGKNDKIKKTRLVRQDILLYYKNKQCVITGTNSDIEIDHKAGNYPINVCTFATQKIEDFQLLHSSINKIKRQHCKVCLDTKTRFKATTLGYIIDYIEEKSTNDIMNKNWCKGCYWYDPKKFNEIVSTINKT